MTLGIGRPLCPAGKPSSQASLAIGNAPLAGVPLCLHTGKRLQVGTSIRLADGGAEQVPDAVGEG
jgi:hypothetical protein